MKKLLLPLLLSLLLVTLIACGGDTETIPDINFEECFTTESVGGLWTVTGVTDTGKAQSVLVIPAQVGGTAVQSVAAGTFTGCSALKIVYIQADSKIAYLNTGAFDGASGLKKIVIEKNPLDITVSGNLLDGAASGAKVYVPADKYADTVAYYTWGAFSAKIAKIEG